MSVKREMCMSRITHSQNMIQSVALRNSFPDTVDYMCGQGERGECGYSPQTCAGGFEDFKGKAAPCEEWVHCLGSMFFF
jgi:hypothetical protein